MEKLPEEVLIIIPTYNEKENILSLIEKAYSICLNNKIQPQFLIVDDDSPDGTADLARELAKKYPIEVLQRKEDRGIGSAYKEAFAHAFKNYNHGYILTMDADNSHDPQFFVNLLEKCGEGFDLVLGSRYTAGGNIVGWGIRRKLISRGANFLTSLILKLNLNDVTTGFRCYRTESLKKLDPALIKSRGFSFMEEILYYYRNKGLKIAEVPITFTDRRLGKSKLGFKDIAKVFTTVIRLRFSAKNEK